MTRAAFVLSAVLLAAAPAHAQMLESTTAERYDLGKMWTFERPPSAYFSETYGFRADSAWFARARLAALRIPGCSAGLVSPHGLIVTNHHCVRSRLASIARPGEALLDSGFVARNLADERRIPDFHADQLIAALDVTEEIDAAVARSGAPGARGAAETAIRDRLKAAHAASGDSVWVQLVALYDGARTSAYVFRRFTDIRFVMAVELQMGFFGGDPDNFTYPRYALDYAVLRAYGANGRPLPTPDHFGWSTEGVQPGDAVFVIGNPGRTARLTTVAQLEYYRDVSVPVSLGWYRSRLEAMRDYYRAEPVEAEGIDLRNRMFTLSNREKSLGGRLEALRDPGVIARRADSEAKLRAAIAADPELDRRFGPLFDRLAEVQAARRAQAAGTRAFSEVLNRTAGSGTLQRAFWGWRAHHAPADSADAFRREFARAMEWPAELERRLLAAQLADMADGFGPDHAVTRAVLGGATPAEAADRLMRTSRLAGPLPTAELDRLHGDPALRLAMAFGPVMLAWQREEARLAALEGAVAADIGRARFAVYGPDVPPDGSSSPRIADGVVAGYPYNGTLAPAWTTFYGMYDRFAAFGSGTDWDLPHRWRTPPRGLDLGTPLNFVSTADSYSGNSGSPAVTRDLRLVGLNFDRNINALVRDYLYLPERGRNVMVDARAIDASLDAVYDMDRIAKELRTGRLFRTEAEADRAREAGPR